MATQIFEHNIPELHQMYSKFPSSDGSLSTLISTSRPDLGTFEVSNMTFPGLHLMDVNWNIPDELIVHESNASQTVDLNFVTKGNLKGSYSGLRTDLHLCSGTNNLKYTPAEKSAHHAIRQDVRMFAIAIERSYFQSLIGCDNAWAEGMQRKLERDEDLFGSDEFLAMTPRMHALVHSIRNMQPTPMTRIMTQSLAFELIAQQIEQLACLNQDKFFSHDLSSADVDKLDKARKFIERNFLEDLTLTSVCREVMLNEFKLKKGFKTLFQTSVIQYVRRLRMELAQNLLRDSKMTVEEVAGKLGYRYPNHFSVAYKKHFGVVPSERF
jgi:AraC-like DNA-binding protein